MGHAFPKGARVLRRGEFLAAQKGGRRQHAPHFVVLFYDRRDDAPARLGLVTSKKVGNAVARNRVRRVLREVFRLNRERFPRGHDVVVIAREGAADLATEQIRDEILGVLTRRGARGSGPSAKEGRAP